MVEKQKITLIFFKTENYCLLLFPHMSFAARIGREQFSYKNLTINLYIKLLSGTYLILNKQLLPTALSPRVVCGAWPGESSFLIKI